MTSRVDAVFDLTGSRICRGIFLPGEALTAEAVQAEADCSRTVAREALGLLVSLGLLRVRRRIGYEVRPAEHWSRLSPDVLRWLLAGPDSVRVLHELMDLRSVVEPAAAAAAAAAQDGGAVEPASRLWAAAAAADRDSFLAADVDFHRAVLRAGGNRLFEALGALIAESLPPRADAGEQLSLSEARAHLDLADAIVAGDADAARSLAASLTEHGGA